MTTNYFNQKIKLVLLPVLKAAFCVMLTYLIFYAICINELELRIKEDFAVFFIPLGIGLITALYLRKYIKRLVYKNDRVDGLYYFVLIFWLWALMFFSAKWLVAVTKPLVSIKSAEEVHTNPGDIYFRINRIQTDTTLIRSSYTITQSHGRGNHSTNIDLYYVTPVIIKNSSSNTFWMCKKYSTSVSSGSSEEAMDREFNEFASLSKTEFRKQEYINSPCYTRLKYSETQIRAIEAIHKALPRIDEARLLILEPQDELPDTSGNQSLKYLLMVVVAGIVAQLILISVALPNLKPVKKPVKSKFENPAFEKSKANLKKSHR